jgi:hypothetical protein
VFPHVHWFDKLWTGFATGGMVGLLVGYTWQLWDNDRRVLSSGRLLLTFALGWGAFSGISLLMFAPDMRSQEFERAKIRSLSTDVIDAICVNLPKQPAKTIQAEQDITSFANLIKRAELFYPSHEASVLEFNLTILLQDGTQLDYPARVPERHLSDISIEFRGPSHIYEIIIPNGRRWLDKFTNKEQ